MKVKAIRKGYYKGIIRNEGDTFEIPDDMVLGQWMVSLDGKKQEQKAKKPASKKPAKGEEVGDLDDII